MAQNIYPIEFDNLIGRAYVKISDEINATKIGNTFLVITMNKNWVGGDRSVLWKIENAFFPELFEFSEIIKTAQITSVFTKPGKSAIVVDQNSEMQKMAANFYKSLAATTTDRKIELFFSEKEAIIWLDSQ